MSITVVLSLLSLFSCALRPLSPSVTQSLQPADLVGTWALPCTASPNGSFWRMSLTYTETQFTFVFGSYQDQECSKSFLIYTERGSYSLGADAAAGKAGRELQTTSSSRVVSAGHPFGAQHLQQSCGLKQVTVGVPVDIAAGCPGMNIPPQSECPVQHDIVRLKGTAIQFGKAPPDGNRCTPDRRPSLYDSEVWFSRE